MTDDLLHLMPEKYSKIHLGQLVSAIWSKYLSLQGGDIATQKQLLSKDKELFQKDKEIQSLQKQLEDNKSKSSDLKVNAEFKAYVASGKIKDFIAQKDIVLGGTWLERPNIENVSEAIAFGLLNDKDKSYISISEKGKEFFKWLFLESSSDDN